MKFLDSGASGRSIGKIYQTINISYLPSICIYMIFKTNNALMFLKRELFYMFVMNSIEPVSVSYFCFDGLTFYI